MATARSDGRDKKTDAIHAFIDAAIVDRSKAPGVVDFLFPEKALHLLSGWPRPTAEAGRIATDAVKNAIPLVREGAALLGLTSVYSISRKVPEPLLHFRDELPEQVVFRAPLVTECLEDAAIYELTQLLAYRFSKPTRDLWDDDVRLGLMRRLNGYLSLEANLWKLAWEGGFDDPPPYAVRYESARWLWSPELNNGHAFCLRCGSELIYKRAAREGSTRRLRCDDCSRGTNPSMWPAHAICPAERGTWWLCCQTEGCSKVFVGHTQARRCPQCTTSKLTAARRKPLQAGEARVGSSPC